MPLVERLGEIQLRPLASSVGIRMLQMFEQLRRAPYPGFPDKCLGKLPVKTSSASCRPRQTGMPCGTRTTKPGRFSVLRAQPRT
jgi:hypothetical protein